MKSSDQKKRGILYIATGDQFIAEANTSAKRTKQFTDLPVAIVTDIDSSNLSDIFDYQITMEDPKHSFGDQPPGLLETPFEQTLYLDTDIYTDSEFTEIFELLDEFDIAAAHNHNRTSFKLDNIPYAFPEYNTGIILYDKNSKTMDFLEDWNRKYDEMETNERGQNQPSFRKCLYKSDLRVATLPPEYNLMIRYPGHAVGSVRFFHGRLMDIDTPGAGEFHDIEEVASKINNSESHRVFTQLGGIAVYSNKEDRIIPKIRLSIQRHGLKETIRRALNKIV